MFYWQPSKNVMGFLWEIIREPKKTCTPPLESHKAWPKTHLTPTSTPHKPKAIFGEFLAGLSGIWLGFPMVLFRVSWGVPGLEWEQAGSTGEHVGLEKSRNTITDRYGKLSYDMYGIFTYIYPKNGPNVGKYFIHGAYGIYETTHFLCRIICDEMLQTLPLHSGILLCSFWMRLLLQLGRPESGLAVFDWKFQRPYLYGINISIDVENQEWNATWSTFFTSKLRLA